MKKIIDDLNEAAKWSRYGDFKKGKEGEFELLVETEIDDEMVWPSIGADDQKKIDDLMGLKCDQFGFQVDNMRNQTELLKSLVLSRMPRYKNDFSQTVQSLFDEIIGQNSNFCVWLRVSGFEFDVTQNYEEKLEWICTFFLVWGEAANLRFCPELMCFLVALTIQSKTVGWETGEFLERVVVPLYSFLRGQVYKYVGNDWCRRNRDHSSVVGYDDVNQRFWSVKEMKLIKVVDGRFLLDLPERDRLSAIGDVQWNDFLRNKKSFYEKRNGWHVLVNFIQIWLLHFNMFYYMVMATAASLLYPSNPLLLFGSGGLLSVFLVIFSLVMESTFLPFKDIMSNILPSLMKSVLVLILNSALPVILVVVSVSSDLAMLLVYIQIVLSLVTSLYLIFVSPRMRTVRGNEFTSSFAPLGKSRKSFSIAFWSLIFVFKSVVSFFYLITPFIEAFGSVLKASNFVVFSDLNFTDISSLTAGLFSIIVTFTFVSLNFILFLLDTYIWFIVAVTIVGSFRSLRNGISILKTQIYINLPEKIKIKLAHGMFKNDSYFVAKVWNSFIYSLYNENLMGKSMLKEYTFTAVQDHEGLKTPPFFVKHEEDVDQDNDSISRVHSIAFSNLSKEGSRRLYFFAQSLSMKLPDPVKVNAAPITTVLIPHYSEKILLTMKDLLQEYEGNVSSVTVLEYLKRLYPEEWHNFVNSVYDADSERPSSPAVQIVGYCQTEDQVRTRIWASLRSQTLFRTVSGFYNYIITNYIWSKGQSDKRMHLLVAVQRYDVMSKQELEDVEILFKCFPCLQISFFKKEGDFYYCCLIDSNCSLNELTLKRKPKFQIKLPGMPILGDGKSDNQNLSLMFTRGEIVQLIDSNQDLYLEEALKSYNILNEFYANPCEQVSIVGSREQIFSERIGALGDNAAGKEYCFGTIAQRVSSMLGSRLHYGHPDFLSSLFFITRGGVSKGQKALHINEDIYCGMNALCRNGVIKHTEYYQAGKGRDLGFCSILSFVLKIGSGMAEQCLSRDQYYIGLTISFDRLLSFYYNHSGFQVTNLLSVVAINMFAFVLFCFNTYADKGQIIEWSSKSVVSMVIVMLITYLPLTVSSSLENGIVVTITRMAKQLVSLTFLFEIFVTSAYGYAISAIGWCLGNTGYQATGRGFSTARLPFKTLYSNFDNLITNGFFILGLWTTLDNFPVCLTFFVIVSCSLIFSPFIYNPSQFDLKDFLLDYSETLNWLFSSISNSWTSKHIKDRSRFTSHSTQDNNRIAKSNFMVLLSYELFYPFVTLLVYIITFSNFATDMPILAGNPIHIMVPVALGLGFSIMIFCLTICFCLITLILSCISFGYLGTFLAKWNSYALKLSGVLVFLTLNLVVAFLCKFQWKVFIAGYYLFVQTCVCYRKLVWLTLGKENKSEKANWCLMSGQWLKHGLLRYIFRETLAKSVEIVSFAFDFFQIHMILFCLFPFALIPKFRLYHNWLLFWAKTDHLPPKIWSKREESRRKNICIKFGVLFIVITLTFTLASAGFWKITPMFLHF